MKKIILLSISLLIILGVFYSSDIMNYARIIYRQVKSGENVSWKRSDIKSGDIIFQTSLSSQSKAIQMATGSVYSHMGIVYIMNGEYFVLEAVQPVKLTPLTNWIARGKDSKFVVKRLRERNKYLTSFNLNKMFNAGKNLIGKNYDIYFGWSDEQIYCSELVWKIYKSINIEIGTLQSLKEFNLNSPEVQKKLRERYGNNIPYDEIVISPAAIFNSDQLVTII